MTGLGALVFGVQIVILFTLVAVYVSRVRRVGPNEVMFISGRKTRNRETGEIEDGRMVTAGRAFIWPGLETVGKLSLELMNVPIKSDNVTIQNGDPVSLEGVACIKFENDPDALQLAAERFLSKSPDDIIAMAQQLLDAHVRTVASTHNSDTISNTGGNFAKQVREVFAADLNRMGMIVDTLTIRRVRRNEL